MDSYKALKKAVKPHTGVYTFIAVVLFFVALFCLVIGEKDSIIAAAVFAVIGVICLIVKSVNKKSSKRCLDNLVKEGNIDAAYADFVNPASFRSGKRNPLVLGDRYVFDSQHGMIYKYNEILLMYKQVIRQGIIPVSQNLRAGLANGKTIQLLNGSVGKKSDEMFEAVSRRIQYYNPDVLVGFTPENLKEYRRLRKEIKAKGLEEVIPSVAPIVFVDPNAAAPVAAAVETAPVETAPLEAAPAATTPTETASSDTTPAE